MLSYLKLVISVLLLLLLLGELLPAWLMLYHLRLFPFDQVNAGNTELLIFCPSAFPVKRSREAHKDPESGTEPQKKRQKDEKKPEDDASSPSSRIQT